MSLFSRKTRDTGTATFAAEPVDLGERADANYMASAVSRMAKANKRAWNWYTKIGEIHYAVSRASRTAGYASLGAYRLNADGTIGKKFTGASVEAEIATQMYSPTGGTRGLIERFITHMKVPGDTWLIRCRDDEGEPDGYDFVAAEEWSAESLEGLRNEDASKRPKEMLRVTMPGTNGRNSTVKIDDVIGRVWRPAGMFADLADSPMYALDDTCEILHSLTRGLKVKLAQKMVMTGFIYIPSEVNDARTAAPKGKGAALHDNKIIDQVLRAAQHAALNPDDPMSPIPIVVSGQGDQSENLRYIIPDFKIFEVEMSLRTELIDRILFGLDINPQGVKGTTEANHWGAWAAADDEMRINIKPDLETMCWALTRLILYAEMVDRGLPAGRITKCCIWYDLSKAVAKTNLAEDGRQAFDRKQIGPGAARRMAGIDNADAPTDDELIRMVGNDMGLPQLALHGVKAADKIDWDKVTPTKTGPNPDSQAPKSKVGPGKGQPGSPNDRDSDTPKRKTPG